MTRTAVYLIGLVAIIVICSTVMAVVGVATPDWFATAVFASLVGAGVSVTPEAPVRPYVGASTIPPPVRLPGRPGA